MKICLTCYQAQSGSGPYCSGCGRTHGKLCENKHYNAPSPHVLCCSTCGSTSLSEPTHFLNLTWLPVVLVGLVALGVWRWAITHLPLLGGLLWHFVVMMLALLLNTTLCDIVVGAHRLLSWLLTLWLIGWMLSLLPGRGGGMGTWLRGLPEMVLKLGWRGAQMLFILLGRTLRRALWVSPRRPKPTSKDAQD